MSVNYTRINWEDSPSTQTPLNAENLNAMDSAIDDLAGAVNDLDGVPGDVEDLQTEIGALKNDFTQFPNGTYPNMSVGNADQLTATVGIEDNAPYLFRTSGGSNDIGDREDIKKLVGGTIVNNQLVRNGDFSDGTTGWTPSTYVSLSASGGKMTLTCNTSSNRDWDAIQNVSIFANHKYLVKGKIQRKLAEVENGSVVNGYGFAITDSTQTNDTIGIFKSISNVDDVVDISEIIAPNGTYDRFSIRKAGCRPSEAVDLLVAWDVQLIDLTVMFGSNITIANYVYSLEQATAGAGVAWLKKHFPAQFDAGYQAYDAGSLQSVSGLTEHKMVGFNQWDEEWERGEIDANGNNVYNSARSRSKNYIPVFPDTTYYHTGQMAIVTYDANKNRISQIGGFYSNRTFVTPIGCHYIRFFVNNATMPSDICINLHWDGERDGQYEPYKEYTYALDSYVVLRGIPKVDASGNLYYDGDEYLPDGTVNRRYGVVDLGTLNWYYSEHRFNTNTSIPGAIGVSTDLRCVKYIPDMGAATRTVDKSVCITNQGYIYIYDTTQAEDANTFKTAMSGVYLLYPLATPTTETALPYQETQIVDDFGTEEFVLADGAFPVPVGHVTMYQNNLRAKLEMSPESPDGDGLYVVQQESGENTYVPLASTATIQDILTRLTALENA